MPARPLDDAPLNPSTLNARPSAMSQDGPASQDAASTENASPQPGDAASGNAPLREEQRPGRKRFAMLLAAAAGLTSALALVLFAVFAGLGLAGAPYGAVGVAVIGGIVMRRVLLDNPSVARTVLFSATCIGGALAGLGVANLLFS